LGAACVAALLALGGLATAGSAIDTEGARVVDPSASDAGDDAEAQPAQAPTCGRPGLPPCPLQGFMRANVAAPLASNDGDQLAASLDRVARLVPDPAWSSWVAAAEAGSAAAKRGDTAAARVACRACHDAWRASYRAKYRLRPIAR
jgi:hypothetical protein